MSCFNCKFYTGSYYVACAVDPITAASSPREGCRDWEEAAPAEPVAEPAEPFAYKLMLILLSFLVLGIAVAVAVNPAAVVRPVVTPVVTED